ncbi:aminoglycoside phosphotransferase, partial [Streptomyces sp. MBT57]|nr:aminoglycoside phosphotransferase [Streptomyces sp. MBT57]
MATTRIGLDRLPPTARAAVEEHTGPLLAVEESTEGFNSEIAARITSATGTWHIKGLRTDHPRAWTQHREATVAPF